MGNKERRQRPSRHHHRPKSDGFPSNFRLNVGKLRLLAAAAGIAEALLEFVHPTSGVNKTLLTSEEWVAFRADTHVKIAHR